MGERIRAVDIDVDTDIEGGLFISWSMSSE